MLRKLLSKVVPNPEKEARENEDYDSSSSKKKGTMTQQRLCDDERQYLPEDKTRRKRGDGKWEQFDRNRRWWETVNMHATEFEDGRDEIVWKAAVNSRHATECALGISLVKLRIPKDAKVNYTGKKCRASEAYVEAIYTIGHRGNQRVLQIEQRQVAYSMYDRDFEYRVGDRVEPRSQFDPTGMGCAPGIHFFRTAQEAAQYANLRLPRRKLKQFRTLAEHGAPSGPNYVGRFGKMEDTVPPKTGL